MSETMTPTHQPSMNLRFVEREIPYPRPDLGPLVSQTRKVRVLQQMMVPKDWSKHEEYWQDVQCVAESELPPNAGNNLRESGTGERQVD